MPNVTYNDVNYNMNFLRGERSVAVYGENYLLPFYVYILYVTMRKFYYSLQTTNEINYMNVFCLISTMIVCKMFDNVYKRTYKLIHRKVRHVYTLICTYTIYVIRVTYMSQILFFFYFILKIPYLFFEKRGNINSNI